MIRHGESHTALAHSIGVQEDQQAHKNCLDDTCAKLDALSQQVAALLLARGLPTEEDHGELFLRVCTSFYAWVKSFFGRSK